MADITIGENGRIAVDPKAKSVKADIVLAWNDDGQMFAIHNQGNVAITVCNTIASLGFNGNAQFTLPIDDPPYFGTRMVSNLRIQRGDLFIRRFRVNAGRARRAPVKKEWELTRQIYEPTAPLSPGRGRPYDGPGFTRADASKSGRQ